MIQLNGVHREAQRECPSVGRRQCLHSLLPAVRDWPLPVRMSPILSPSISVIFLHFFTAFISHIGHWICVHLVDEEQRKILLNLKDVGVQLFLAEMGIGLIPPDRLEHGLLHSLPFSIRYRNLALLIGQWQFCSLFPFFPFSCSELPIINYAIMLLTNREEIKLTCSQRAGLDNCERCCRSIIAVCL